MEMEQWMAWIVFRFDGVERNDNVTGFNACTVWLVSVTYMYCPKTWIDDMYMYVLLQLYVCTAGHT